jgi:hypothetical protein
VVGLIASIRRILVISLEMATLTKEGSWSSDGASIFRAAMIELGLLGLLVLVLVLSVTLMRRYPPALKIPSRPEPPLGLAARKSAGCPK